MSIGSIQQGELSAKQGDGGVYSERLKAFQKSYVKPEFTDIAKEFNDAINGDKIKAENFSKAALNSKVVPSTSKMYESHFQLAKDKFDILYDDETLNHFSKDEAGMRKWSELVDQLNNEIDMYEQIYEDSYGDPSTAKGDGYTWADYQQRAKSFNGDEQGWFNAQGFRSNNPNSAIETMKSIDSKQHSNLTFDFDSGTFDYDVSDGFDTGFLEPTDPNVAYNVFAYQTEQDRFSDATVFVESIYPAFTSYGEEAAKERVSTNLRTQNNFILSAISSYQNKLDDDAEEKNLTPQQYQKILDSGSLDAILDDFEADVIEAAKQRKKREDDKNKPKNPVNPVNPPAPPGGYASSVYKSKEPQSVDQMKNAGVDISDKDKAFKITFNQNVYFGRLVGDMGVVYAVIDDEGAVKYYSFSGDPLSDNDMIYVNNRLSNDLKQEQNLSDFISGGSTSQNDAGDASTGDQAP